LGLSPTIEICCLILRKASLFLDATKLLENKFQFYKTIASEKKTYVGKHRTQVQIDIYEVFAGFLNLPVTKAYLSYMS
jgi:hypothetical protein